MSILKNKVIVERCNNYDRQSVDEVLALFDALFAETIGHGETVVIKPNWIAPCHKYNAAEWQSVITHPHFISAVVRKVIRQLNGKGKIVIADAPQTDTVFSTLVGRMPIDEWTRACNEQGIDLEVLDLRDHEWTNEGDIIISRRTLPGDPMGSVEYNLRDDMSEFYGHQPSPRGYYGADCDIKETNLAHANGNHLYRVSRTVISADVFINLPKWKTHKKAGITCSLKNLVGINTYKNYLPHHTEGTPAMGGDQFPSSNVKSAMEVYMLEYFKKILLRYDKYSKYMIPLKKLGKVIFGATKDKIRSGNWYGNDTLWRTILDLNKILLYGNTDGTMKEAEVRRGKKYLSFVDGIIAGEGNGPEAPDPLNTGIIIGGSNPVSVDCVAARLMGFDYLKIPSLYKTFRMKRFPIADFSYTDVEVMSRTIPPYNSPLIDISKENCFCFKPHFGWVHNIELS